MKLFKNLTIIAALAIASGLCAMSGNAKQSKEASGAAQVKSGAEKGKSTSSTATATQSSPAGAQPSAAQASPPSKYPFLAQQVPLVARVASETLRKLLGNEIMMQALTKSNELDLEQRRTLLKEFQQFYNDNQAALDQSIAEAVVTDIKKNILRKEETMKYPLLHKEIPSSIFMLPIENILLEIVQKSWDALTLERSQMLRDEFMRYLNDHKSMFGETLYSEVKYEIEKVNLIQNFPIIVSNKQVPLFAAWRNCEQNSDRIAVIEAGLKAVDELIAQDTKRSALLIISVLRGYVSSGTFLQNIKDELKDKINQRFMKSWG